MRINRSKSVKEKAWALSIALIFFCFGCAEPATDADIEALKAEGGRLIEKIERYKKHHDHYPGTLKEVTMNIGTEYGDWSYDMVNRKFFLTVGNYKRSGFMLTWDNEQKTWQVHRR